MRRLTALAAAVLAAGSVTACDANTSSMPKEARSAQASAASNLIRESAPPWPVLLDQSKQLISLAGLPTTQKEQLVVHYHAHLDVTVDGSPVTVPADIGILAKRQGSGYVATGIAPLHTHDESGVLHIESATNEKFTLGQFFTEWGVRLSGSCIGGLCSGSGRELRVYVDGMRYSGDPKPIVLTKHEEIAIQYGDPSSLPTPPSSYNFPAGL